MGVSAEVRPHEDILTLGRNGARSHYHERDFAYCTDKFQEQFHIQSPMLQ